MIIRQLVAIFLLTSVTFLIVSCGKADKIEGNVHDMFGNPLSNVVMTIKNTSFTATTDKYGKYSIDYVPGDIKLAFHKDPFISTEINLSIQQKVHYPAKTINLYQIPKEKGLYYIDLENRQLVKLKIEKERVTSRYKAGLGGLRSDYVVNLANPVEVKAGEVTFIDTYPERIKMVGVAAAGKRSVILENPLKGRDRLSQEEPKQIKKKERFLRSYKLKPETYYALVSWGAHLRPEIPKEEGVVFGIHAK